MKYQFTHYLPKEAKMIREKVFMEEQGFEDEFDDIDFTCIHLVVFDDEQPIGCARLIKDNNAVFGRIAVLKEYRHHHIGSYILQCLEEKAEELGYQYTELSAQVQAIPFYLKNGYEVYGDEYLDEGCPHRHMKKAIKT